MKHTFLKNAGLALTLSCTLLQFGCGPQPNAKSDGTRIAGNLRPLTQSERAQDFDQLFSAFKAYYGPYEYKERVLGINIEAEMSRLKDLGVNAASDEEFAGYVAQFAAILHDGHVGVRQTNSSSGISGYRIPIFVEMIEGKVIVSEIDSSLKKEMGISVGDEIIEVDGKEPASYMPTIGKYEHDANEKSQKVNIFRLFSRPSFMTDLAPKTQMVNIKIKKTDDGDVQALDIPWQQVKFNAELDKVVKQRKAGFVEARWEKADVINSLTANANLMGAETPFFVTEKAQRKYNFIKVYPSDDSLKSAGLEEVSPGVMQKPAIYAGLYRHNNKNILLVRQPGYSPEDYDSTVYLKAYKAVLKEYENMADVLVLDQTHNPGGSVDYCTGFFELFAKPGDSQAVQKYNVDRKWINNLSIEWPKRARELKLPWDAAASEALSAKIEQAYDNNQSLSEALPFNLYSQNTVRNSNSVWKKPMIVLIDELAGSCGDAFPSLIKANGTAKLFGQQTMGLGGNVESVEPLNNSRMTVRLTRGLFTAYKADGNYRDQDMVENNGVMPDREYSHTVKDFRAGYVDYIKAFSDYAVEQIPQQPASQPDPASKQSAEPQSVKAVKPFTASN